MAHTLQAGIHPSERAGLEERHAMIPRITLHHKPQMEARLLQPTVRGCYLGEAVPAGKVVISLQQRLLLVELARPVA